MEIKLIHLVSPEIASSSAYSSHSDNQQKVDNLKEKTIEEVLDDIHRYGHLSPFEHINFSIRTRLSRGFAAELFEAKHYITTQQSQRFTKTFEKYTPKMKSELSLKRYNESFDFTSERISEIEKILRGTIDEPEIANRIKLPKEEITKQMNQKVLDNVRYLWPLSAAPIMTYTINMLTWMRYNIMENYTEFPQEKSEFVSSVNSQIFSKYPLYKKYVPMPRKVDELPEEQFYKEKESAGLLSSANISDWSSCTATTPSERVLYGLKTLFPNAEICEEDNKWINDPNYNTYRKSKYDEGIMSGFGSILNHNALLIPLELAHHTFVHRIRNRAISGTRQFLKTVPEKPDYITPSWITEISEAKALYNDSINAIWEYKNLMSQEEGDQVGRYLLPNATRIRQIVSGSELGWDHFFRQRLCKKAQPETFEAARKIYDVLIKVNPDFYKHSGPPCMINGRCHESEPSLECIERRVNSNSKA